MSHRTASKSVLARSTLVRLSAECILCLTLVAAADSPPSKIDLAALKSPVLFRGDERTAYRDPAAVYHDGVVHLYFTYVKTEPDGLWMFTAASESRDLVHWTAPRILTPRDQKLNFSSPGNVVRFGNEWIMCLQTYPRPNGEKYGNQTARLWTMRSKDLVKWSEPQLLRVKGSDVSIEQMGRMIDPFLMQDKDDAGKWWCLFKQNGVSFAWSRDLKNWTFAGSARAGENVCVIVDREADEYVMFHSPANGVGVKRSRDLKRWQDVGLFTLGQRDWPWAREGRLTAGFVLDLKQEQRVGKYLIFFHASEKSEKITFDTFCHLGIAWSDDLTNWDWPGKTGTRTETR